MARFIGRVQGQAGEATRLGSVDSGLRVNADGWDLGVRVSAWVTPHGDEFRIYATGGSNGSEPDRLVAIVTRDNHIHIERGRDG